MTSPQKEVGADQGDQGRARAVGTGLSSDDQAAARLAPSGFDPSRIPFRVSEQVLAMGRVEWGATAAFDDAGHIAHLAGSLRKTREHFGYDDLPCQMHGLYLKGTETVLAHTGTSPNSGANAQALSGAWNWLHDQCLAQSARDSDGSGEDGETGTGSTEGDSAGRQASPTPQARTQDTEGTGA